MQGCTSFLVGTKVKVKDFPIPIGQAAPFDFNGLTGIIKSSQKVGFGLGNKPIYNYLVTFKDIEVPYSRMNPATRKIERGSHITDAEQFFEEIFLTKVV